MERVWFWIGIRSWDWIKVLSCETVIWGFSIETRSKPSRLRTLSIIFVNDDELMKALFSVENSEQNKK